MNNKPDNITEEDDYVCTEVIDKLIKITKLLSGTSAQKGVLIVRMLVLMLASDLPEELRQTFLSLIADDEPILKNPEGLESLKKMVGFQTIDGKTILKEK